MIYAVLAAFALPVAVSAAVLTVLAVAYCLKGR